MITYNYAEVNGQKMFYREAGDKSAPTIVLLHGFPTSSHMYRNLIPQLADTFHVIAPDYIGFGYSDAPNVREFSYTFDNLATHVEKLLFGVLGLKRFSPETTLYNSTCSTITALTSRFTTAGTSTSAPANRAC
jgi:pimeloyl-ACP methyl ester carboxylesterase